MNERTLILLNKIDDHYLYKRIYNFSKWNKIWFNEVEKICNELGYKDLNTFFEAYGYKYFDKEYQSNEIINELDKIDNKFKKYIIYGVKFEDEMIVYNYKSNIDLSFGDYVLAPFSYYERIGRIINASVCTRKTSPYQVNKTRKIIKKLETNEIKSEDMFKINC